MKTDSGETAPSADVQSQLQVKDQLIAALTAQLEETAEKLDRLQRTGGPRGSSVGRGTEEIPHAPELFGQLEDVIEVWQELKPGERLLRIEEGVEQILSMLSSGELAQPAQPETSSNQAFWEAAKAQLLGEQPDESPAQEEPPAQPDLPEVPPEPPPPEPLGEDADEETLWRGIEEREVYIQYLTARLRHAEQRQAFPVPWGELNNAPKELKQRLEGLQQQLSEQLKQAEIAHALERASLTRERAQLEQMKQQVEKQMRQLKASSTTHAENEESTADRKERRWSRLFSKD
jgi:hypothetical protein